MKPLCIKLLDFIAFLHIISYTENNGRDRLFSGPLARHTKKAYLIFSDRLFV